jgi:hypothetical protein
MTKKSSQTSNQTAPHSLLKKSHKIMIKNSLDRILELAPAGYTHESFTEINRLVREVSFSLNLEELKDLESLYRDLYTDSCDLVKLDSVAAEIKSRFS